MDQLAPPSKPSSIGRRGLLASAGASIAASLASPAIADTPGRTVLRFVPESDLTVLDPIWTTATVTQAHAYLVFDMLFGLDEQFQVQPQMAESAMAEQDGRIWRIRLREGLRFHDGSPVLARDCVASIRRWGARDPFGATLLSVTDELTAADDRTIVFRLRRPFPLLPAALGKPIANVCAIMPERLAMTDPSHQVTEMVGSGPFRFLPNERLAGSRTVYERFDGYVPRPSGVAAWTAGPKIAHFDRVEWNVIPDGATAAAALGAGEVDWIETPDVDLLPMLRRKPNVVVEVKNPTGRIAMLRLNHLHPPFDKPAVREALLRAIDQKEFMAAVAGDDPSLSRTDVGFFTPGTPLASGAGLEVWANRPDMAASRQAIAAAGYAGETVVMLAPADRPTLRAMADVGVDLMQKLGMKVDYQLVDWGTVVTRRSKKEAPAQGGWNVIPGDWIGLDAANPSSYPPLRGNGSAAWFGWPNSPDLEALRDQWLYAPDLAAQQATAAEMQRVAFRDVPFIPLGQYFSPIARSRALSGILTGSTLFWNVRRA